MYYSYLNTERVSVVHTTPVSATIGTMARTVRLVGTVNFLFSTTGDATNETSHYVPKDAVIYLSLPKNCELSLMAELGSVGTNYVYVTEVV